MVYDPSGWASWQWDLHIDPEPLLYGTHGGHYDEVKYMGDFILHLQEDLNDAGFTDDTGAKLVEDGVYGPKTRAAHRKMVYAVGMSGSTAGTFSVSGTIDLKPA
jgi:hypothetical protein